MDLGTPLTLLDKLSAAVGAVIADNADFSGQFSVNICECTAPLKLGVSVWWENSFNGELLVTMGAQHRCLEAERDHSCAVPQQPSHVCVFARLS